MCMWHTGLQKLRKEFDTLAAQLENSKKQVEAETVQRVDLQNRIQSLKEELDFKASIHAQVCDDRHTDCAHVAGCGTGVWLVHMRSCAMA